MMSSKNPDREENQTQYKVRRAFRLAHDGAYSKAVSALLSEGVHPATEQVLEILREKHPQEPEQFDERFEKPAVGNFPHKPQHEPFTVLEVRDAIERSPPASSGGGSALTFTHLKELVRGDSTDAHRGLGRVLAAF